LRNVKKSRIDLLLVSKGFVSTREKARALVMAGKVWIGNNRIDKPGVSINVDSDVVISGSLPYVGRGGTKLAHALDSLGINVEDSVFLDVGASTGGFTDCLIQNGAKRVYAVDVGYGQLDFGLRNNPQVVVIERTNARYPFVLPEKVDGVTIDVSFISVTQIIPSILNHLAPLSWVLVLVKPQFEAGRQDVGKKGIVRDPIIHAQTIGKVILWAISNGLRVVNLTPSPILGDKGNREFFLLLSRS